ncbi:MAG: hypothetical protein ACREJJ_00445 [Candidatus Methylomirabilales bacterium]
MTPPLIAPADCAYGTPVILESFGRGLSRTVRACLLGSPLKGLRLDE